MQIKGVIRECCRECCGRAVLLLLPLLLLLLSYKPLLGYLFLLRLRLLRSCLRGEVARDC